MKTKMFTLIIFVLSLVLSNKAQTNGDTETETISKRRACSSNETDLQPSDRIDTTDKLAALRKLMISRPDALQAYLVPSDDEHQTEYVSEYDRRLRYISGFSGSSGNAVITLEKAALWTDGRYHIQAEEQLDCNWLIMKEGRGAPSRARWLAAQFPNGARIGADPKLMPAGTWKVLESELTDLNENLTLLAIDDNLIDAIWVGHEETDDIREGFTLDIAYTGKTWAEKVSDTKHQLKRLGADSMVVTALDEVAWLLNIRGYDIPNSGLLKSYVILTQNETILYADPRKIAGNITETLPISNADVSNVTIQFKNYQDIWTDLPIFSQSRKMLVPSPCSYSPGASMAVYDLVADGSRIREPSPIIDLKAKKNPTEILGMERAHIRDSAALCRFLQYFESRFNAGEAWDELRVAQFVNMFRAQQDLFVNISFSTISAFGAHGALPHYQATASTSSTIFNNSTLVLDSGGQYYDGTTDVTRTIHLGTPTDKQKDAYTRVLMGSIQMSELIFPSHLAMSSIDVLARAPLWKTGYDYPHGTGHGIGAFLTVHESPISIHYGSIKPQHFTPGHFLSNEPGFYLKGEFGIRLENTMEVIEKTNFKDRLGHFYLGFKHVTLVPYDMKLVDYNLLENNHIRWLNKYNSQIRKLVGPELKRQNATDAFNWMIEKTKCISVKQVPLEK